MTTIILTRHGEVEGIDPPRFRGRMELALTDTGRKQARLTGEAIAARWNASTIYCSPMARCRATAAAIASACAAPPAEVLDDLNDFDYGDFQWRTHDEVRVQAPVFFSLWRRAPQLVRFPGGESLQDVVARAANALRTVLARHVDETVVLVGHDSVNRALLLQLIDQPLSAFARIAQDPCAINVLEVVHGVVHVKSVNDTGHLVARIKDSP